MILSFNDLDGIEVGYCKECGRMDEVSKFEQKENDLLCCSKVSLTGGVLGQVLIFSLRVGTVSRRGGSSILSSTCTTRP